MGKRTKACKSFLKEVYWDCMLANLKLSVFLCRYDEFLEIILFFCITVALRAKTSLKKLNFNRIGGSG